MTNDDQQAEVYRRAGAKAFIEAGWTNVMRRWCGCPYTFHSGDDLARDNGGQWHYRGCRALKIDWRGKEPQLDASQ